MKRRRERKQRRECVHAIYASMIITALERKVRTMIGSKTPTSYCVGSISQLAVLPNRGRPPSQRVPVRLEPDSRDNLSCKTVSLSILLQDRFDVITHHRSQISIGNGRNPDTSGGGLAKFKKDNFKMHPSFLIYRIAICMIKRRTNMK